MAAERTGNYIADHWYGRQGFSWSFWVNLVLLRVLIFLLQQWWSPVSGSDYNAFALLVLSLAVFFHGFVFTWQLVGAFRAGEAYIAALGTQAMPNFWGSQLGAIIIFWLTTTYAYGAWQMTLPAPDNKTWHIHVEAERLKKYRFTPSSDGTQLAFKGSIELGATKQFLKQLAAHPRLQTIILASPGGNIYEARGLSILIRDNHLNTRVETLCSSACTTVFIGGINRELDLTARLGFHQYRIDADYDVLNFDAAAEQDHDRMLYAAADVKPWFLEKMHQRPSDDMWFPKINELLDSGVVTGISDAAPQK